MCNADSGFDSASFISNNTCHQPPSAAGGFRKCFLGVNTSTSTRNHDATRVFAANIECRAEHFPDNYLAFANLEYVKGKAHLIGNGLFGWSAAWFGIYRGR